MTKHPSNTVSGPAASELGLRSPALPREVSIDSAREAPRSADPQVLDYPAIGKASLGGALAKLSDNELLARLADLVQQERGLTVEVLLHLAEVERRDLHLVKGCSSLFAYCVQRLGFSEDVAYKRVGAARYGRRFPLALDLMARGVLHLSALMLVGPHLTDANHREWLMAAAGNTKREVELLVAARCPKPDVPSAVRKLPERQVRSGGGATTRQPAAVGEERADLASATQSASADGTTPSGVGVRPPNHTRVGPLSDSTYRVVFTASSVCPRELMAH